MKWNKQKLVFVAFIASILLIYSQTAHAPTYTQTHSLDTSTFHFLFDNDSRLKFGDNTIHLGDSNGLWTWLDSNGIRFYNLRMDGDSLSTWTIRVDSANVTVTNLFKDSELDFTVSAPTWTTSTTQIDCGDYGKPYSVSGATSWTYNYASNIATVTVFHMSSRAVTLRWVLPTTFVTTIRNNYFLAFSLISLVPIVIASMIVIGIIKGRENLDMKELLGLYAFIIAMIIGFVILIYIMNALI